MKYSIAFGAIAASASAAPGLVERQYGYPTTKPIVNAVRPHEEHFELWSHADERTDASEGRHHN